MSTTGVRERGKKKKDEEGRREDGYRECPELGGFQEDVDSK